MFHSLPITSTWYVHSFVTKLFSKENTYNIISIFIIKVDSFKYYFLKSSMFIIFTMIFLNINDKQLLKRKNFISLLYFLLIIIIQKII